MPTITSVNNGSPIPADGTNIPFTGTGLGANTAARTVKLVQGAIEVTQTQVTGDATSGTFNVTRGNLANGAVTLQVVVA